MKLIIRGAFLLRNYTSLNPKFSDVFSLPIKIVRSRRMEEPFTEYIINPKTGRLVKTRGKVGREVIGVDICRLYKPRPGFAPRRTRKMPSLSSKTC